MSVLPTKRLFDVYIAIDFTGSRNTRFQRRHIAFAELEGDGSTQVSLGRTREQVTSHLLERLRRHDAQGKRVLCGFDFSYSFPARFWSTLTGLQEKWPDMIKTMAEGVSGLPPISEEPESNARQWAGAANSEIALQMGVLAAPFWGPNFSQSKDPRFFQSGRIPFKEFRASEERLLERHYRPKPIFKIGGHGSVGLQSLCGIPQLFRLRTICSKQNVPLHFWPFDGWTCRNRHVIVEWYPAMHNTGLKNDCNDARACVEWAKSHDQAGTLSRYFRPTLSQQEKGLATFEGWVLGIR